LVSRVVLWRKVKIKLDCVWEYVILWSLVNWCEV